MRHLETKKHGVNEKKVYFEEKEYGVESKKRYKMSTNEHKMSTNEHKMSTNLSKFVEISEKSGKNMVKFQGFGCIYCCKSFKTHPNKRRHELHYCKKNPEFIEKIVTKKSSDIIRLESEKHILIALEKEKDKQILKLEKKVDRLTEKIGNTTNIQNNIKINSYGNEDLSYITEEFKTNLIMGPYGMIPKMIKAIHFNDRKPENQNIIIPNINKNIIKIKNGEEWMHKNKDMVLVDMIDNKYLMLDEHFNLIVNGEKINRYTKDVYIKFREKYDERDKKLMSDIKDNCELVIMNNRDKKI